MNLHSNGRIMLNLDLSLVEIDGDIIPITTMLDCDGDETEDKDLAIVVVAGPTRKEEWLTLALSEFEPIKAN